VSGTLTNDGIISANGGPVSGIQAGGGAGGSLYINTTGLAGSGTFAANGGAGGEAGGGGGRVALYYRNDNGVPKSALTANGGKTGGAGAVGTVVFFSPCDIDGGTTATLADVQSLVNEARGATAPSNDVNLDGIVNVVDVQIEINAAILLGCTPPGHGLRP
jgi:hypothetical protein